MENLLKAIREAKQETENNRKKAFSNIGKLIEKIQPFENEKYLSLLKEFEKFKEQC